ncbi:zf-HC2 domain-containing protein [Actinokineospora sp. HUAS TT18]|uniref:zf-HC2 domain-containing protein n=1 Tax=Actinokineospora sp. HUAS TT18 TaxID=3447451 RepID=UPI003F5229D8
MDCDLCREAVSARLDNEAEPAGAAAVDEHLARCADCRAWQASAVDLTRSLRVRPAVAVPDLTAAILAAAPERLRVWPRFALGLVAIAQLTLALAQIMGVDTTAHHVDHGHAGPFAGHLFNESTAWNLALGVGLGWAALRPKASAGLIPVLSGFVVVLLGYSVYDLIADAVPTSRVISHGVLVLALALLLIVRYDAASPTPGHGDVLGTPEDYTDDSPASAPQREKKGSRRGHLRPASRHRAA